MAVSGLELRLTGPLWKKAPGALEKSAGRITEWAEETMRDVVVDAHAKMVNGIKGLSPQYAFRFRKLNKKYVRRKLGQGQPAWQLEATGEYVRNIRVKASGNSAKIYMTDRRHKRTGLKLSTLARYLEQGTRTMKPLPHWGLVFRRIRGAARSKFRRFPRGTVRFT